MLVGLVWGKYFFKIFEYIFIKKKWTRLSEYQRLHWYCHDTFAFGENDLENDNILKILDHPHKINIKLNL